MATNCQSITRFDCCAAARLLNRPNIQEYWWMWETIGEVWIGLEQSVIDAGINEWRKCFRAEPMFVGQHFKHFCRQLKTAQLNKLSAKMIKIWTKCVFCVLFSLSNNTKVVKMQYFVRFLSPGSTEIDNGWGRWETKQSFDGQISEILIFQKYSCQNLLQLDYFFQVVMKKMLVCFYASQCKYSKAQVRLAMIAVDLSYNTLYDKSIANPIRPSGVWVWLNISMLRSYSG